MESGVWIVANRRQAPIIMWSLTRRRSGQRVRPDNGDGSIFSIVLFGGACVIRRDSGSDGDRQSESEQDLQTIYAADSEEDAHPTPSTLCRPNEGLSAKLAYFRPQGLHTLSVSIRRNGSYRRQRWFSNGPLLRPADRFPSFFHCHSLILAEI